MTNSTDHNPTASNPEMYCTTVRRELRNHTQSELVSLLVAEANRWTGGDLTVIRRSGGWGARVGIPRCHHEVESMGASPTIGEALREATVDARSCFCGAYPAEQCGCD